MAQELKIDFLTVSRYGEPPVEASAVRAFASAGLGAAEYVSVDITDAAKLASAAVTAEVVAHTKGPKIRIHKFKNKTGYHKRQGHRQPLTRVKVTGIKSGK